MIFLHYDEGIDGSGETTRIWSGPHDWPAACSAEFQNDRYEQRILAGSVAADASQPTPAATKTTSTATSPRMGSSPCRRIYRNSRRGANGAKKRADLADAAVF